MSDGRLIGYCHYCKEPIYLYDTYIVYDDEKYHKDCYLLIIEDKELEENND